MKEFSKWKKAMHAAVLAGIVLLAMAATPLPSYNNIYIDVANNGGAMFDDQLDGTYYVKFNGTGTGLGAIHLATQSDDFAGTDYFTYATSGTFYITNTGGLAYFDEMLLLISVNAPALPPDFAVDLSISGYSVTVVSDVVQSRTYLSPALNETFDSTDFIYGLQTSKPSGDPGYPLWVGEDTANAANNSYLMFVDLYVGSDSQTASLIDNGQVKVNYSFTNLPGMATFNAYGYRVKNKQIRWGNSTLSMAPDFIPPNGWKVMPINDLAADIYNAGSRRSVDGDDLIWLALHYGMTSGDAGWIASIDLVADNVIDDQDVGELMRWFGTTY